jgi:hypothetical protein
MPVSSCEHLRVPARFILPEKITDKFDYDFPVRDCKVAFNALQEMRISRRRDAINGVFIAVGVK